MADVVGTSGNDTLNGTGAADTITGLGGNDTIAGGDGADSIEGGAGDDTIDGGLNGSIDTAVFSGNYSNYQIITGVMINGVAHTTVTGLGAFAFEGTDTLRNIESLRFADITVSLGVPANNLPILGQPQMVDQAINDGAFYSYQIPATSFIDLDANDVLSLRATLADGSPLPAWLTLDSATRTFTGTPPISAIGAVLTIRVFATDNDPEYPGFEIHDDFVLTINQAAGADINGTSGNDTLAGTFRDELLNGADGDDILLGSLGADRMAGQSGTDIVDYSAASGGIVVNLDGSANSGELVAGDLLISIEGVIGSAFNDTLNGSLGFDFFWGGGGNDSVFGAGGDDFLYGEAGEDLLRGGDGNDRLVGGAGSDDLRGGDGADFLWAGNGTPPAALPFLPFPLTNPEMDRGTERDILAGGAGDDNLVGGFGDDLDGGANTPDGDRLYISFAGALAGVTADFRNPTLTIGGGTITGFEYVLLIEGSNFDDILTGDDSQSSAQTTTIRGLGGDDDLFAGAYTHYLYGGDGDDFLGGTASNFLIALDGGAGNDLLVSNPNTFASFYGGDGNDEIVLRAGANAQVVDGGAGFDTLSVFGQSSIYSLSGIESLSMQAGSSLTLTGFQFANGFALNSTISGVGTLAVNMTPGVAFLSKLFTFIGNLTIQVNGSSGSDVMKLGNYSHTANGGDGTDQIKGGNLVDTINGGNGNDKIMGLGGADILTGGAGNDVFRYLAQNDSGVGANADRISDFTIGQDRLNFVQIDADAALAGDQAFTFLGSAAFAATGLGQLRYLTAGSDLIVQADVNGDGVTDMEVVLQGLSGQVLTSADFVL